MRDGVEVAPGEPYRLSMDLSVTSNAFLPGHRIRLEVSSSYLGGEKPSGAKGEIA
jgi:predicted acyl esterase